MPCRSARRFPPHLRLLLPLALAAALPLGACGPSPHTPAGTPAASMAGTTSPSDAGRVPAPAWKALPASPLPKLREVTGVWTGREFLVTGNDDTGTGHTAGYDPGAQRWRSLAAPPGPRGGTQGYPRSVWTGTEMVVWGGDHHEIYDLTTDRWREIPDESEHAPQGDAFALVWTGTRVIGFGGGCCEGASDTGGVLDPATGTWEPLPKGPLTPRTTDAVWTGTEMVIVGGNGVAPGTGPSTGTAATSPPTADPGLVRLRDAAAYDPATRRWRSLPPLPFAGAVQVFWDGERVVAVGDAGAATWSPRTNTWTALPPTARRRVDGYAVLAGHQLVVLGGRTPDSDAQTPIPVQGEVLPLSHATWTPLPQVRGLQWLTEIVWTGREVLVYDAGTEPHGLELTL